MKKMYALALPLMLFSTPSIRPINNYDTRTIAITAACLTATGYALYSAITYYHRNLDSYLPLDRAEIEHFKNIYSSVNYYADQAKSRTEIELYQQELSEHVQRLNATRIAIARGSYGHRYDNGTRYTLITSIDTTLGIIETIQKSAHAHRLSLMVKEEHHTASALHGPLLAAHQESDEALRRKINALYYQANFPILACVDAAQASINCLCRSIATVSNNDPHAAPALMLVQELRALVETMVNFEEYQEQKIKNHELLEAQRERDIQERIAQAKMQEAAAARDQAYAANQAAIAARKQAHAAQEQARIERERWNKEWWDDFWGVKKKAEIKIY